MGKIYTLARKTWSAYRNGGIETIKLKVRQKLYDRAVFNSYGITLDPNTASPYRSEYQNNVRFDQYRTDIKALAFYLPQYHTFPENDEWWGKGFTEWTNTSKASPRFKGHYQPRVPHDDFGYYFLDNADTIRKQVKLAKEHGLYGFCFYYYWFSGKRLLEKPVDIFLENKDIDFPFCFCWANENWTRTWDGLNQNILIKQEYSEEDRRSFIIDIRKYLDDERYIRVDGKPVIVVYNPRIIPHCKDTFLKWRETAREIGIGEIVIWTVQGDKNMPVQDHELDPVIDGEIEFPPHGYGFPEIHVPEKMLKVRSGEGSIFDYSGLVNLIEDQIRKEPQDSGKVPVYRTCMMDWDNSCRRKTGWNLFYNYSLSSFYKWLRILISDTRQKHDENDRFLFINAWNEWGEGTYLEPDQKYGYANINTFSRAVFDLPAEDCESEVFTDHAADRHIFREDPSRPRIAIQAHIFYPELADEIIRNLNYIPYAFDCYISTDSQKKVSELEGVFREKCHCRNLQVQVFENRGRDVAPFLRQISPVIDEYDYICHIHSKRTKTRGYGNTWRKYLYHSLFGSGNYMGQLFDYFESHPEIGIVFPENYPLLSNQLVWSRNFDACCDLLKRMSIETSALPDHPLFPAGDMFWARTKAVRKLFKLNIPLSEFPEEAGQIDGTTAHAIERSWVYIARSEGFEAAKITYIQKVPLKQACRVSIYAHTSDCSSVSAAEIGTLRKLKEVSSCIYFMTDHELAASDYEQVRVLADRVIVRDHKGFKYGAWKDGYLLARKDFSGSEIDQMIFTASDVVPTSSSITYMFSGMEDYDCDFWGITVSPEEAEEPGSSSGTAPYYAVCDQFLVFRKQVLYSDLFRKLMNGVQYDHNYQKAQFYFNDILMKNLRSSFRCGAALPETAQMYSLVGSNDIVHTHPYGLAVLGSPFILKSAVDTCPVSEECSLRSVLVTSER